LIENNSNRHSKKLWTDRADGEKVKVLNYYDDREEARAIADDIDMMERLKKCTLSDIAILVRAGYQTRSFEESLNFLGIPYRIVGSTKFYDRTEVRDSIAYIRLIVNKDDNLAFERVVNLPKRGVGSSTLKSIMELARKMESSFFVATKAMIDEKKSKSKAIEALKQFIICIEDAEKELKEEHHCKVVDKLLERVDYIKMWQQKEEGSKEVLDNIKEFVRSLNEYEYLSEFLQYISLVSESDNIAEDNRVNIMTIHASKGLEFETVFLPGWEEGVFPSSKSLEEKCEKGLEEERRLAYVAITRAKKNLIISCASCRMIYGSLQRSEISRFINELPKDTYQVVNGYFNSSTKKNNNFVAETLKKKQFAGVKNDKFTVGEKVEHSTFGRGIILATAGNIKEVFFEKTGIKKIMAEFLKII
jgi:DNA helicase-2/ATP-dependent DNA helicase PcrA